MPYSTALPIPPQPTDCKCLLPRSVVECTRPHNVLSPRPVPAFVSSDLVQYSPRSEPVVRLPSPWVDKLPGRFPRRLFQLCTRQSKDKTAYLALCFPSYNSSEALRLADSDKRRGV